MTAPDQTQPMTNWAKNARLYQTCARDTICCLCDEPIRAGEPIQ